MAVCSLSAFSGLYDFRTTQSLHWFNNFIKKSYSVFAATDAVNTECDYNVRMDKSAV